MPRQRKAEPRTEQVNFKLTRRHDDILDAVAFVDRADKARLVRQVVERYLEERAEDPDVKQVLEVRLRREGT